MRCTTERHEQWVGLRFILEHGYPDQPPAPLRDVNPRAVENKLNQRAYRARQKRSEMGEA
jgi:hypothetical protein